MADVEMRPRFVIPLRCGQDAVLGALRERIADADPEFEGSFTPGHCVLRVSEARRSLWSPELDLTFEPSDAGDDLPEAGVRVRGLFAPRPAVWTGFAFFCAALAAVAVVSSMYGVAQLGLGGSCGPLPWGSAPSC